MKIVLYTLMHKPHAVNSTNLLNQLRNKSCTYIAMKVGSMGIIILLLLASNFKVNSRLKYQRNILIRATLLLHTYMHITHMISTVSLHKWSDLPKCALFTHNFNAHFFSPPPDKYNNRVTIHVCTIA